MARKSNIFYVGKISHIRGKFTESAVLVGRYNASYQSSCVLAMVTTTLKTLFLLKKARISTAHGPELSKFTYVLCMKWRNK